MDWHKDARGGADMKTIIAVLFAVGGLSWAGVSIMTSGKKDVKPEGPRVVDAVVDDEGNEIDANYTKASSDKQIDQVKGEIEQAIQQQAQAALAQINAPKGLPDGLSDATLNAFIPVLSGDHDSFIDAIIAMGGKVPGELEDDHPMFTHLSKVFKEAKVDLSRITVERYVAQQRQMQMRQTEDDEVDGDSGTSYRTQVMEMQPASLFPDAPDKKDATAVEIKIPVQPKGDKNESIFALVLTWNKDAKLWQPAAYRVIKNRLMEDG